MQSVTPALRRCIPPLVRQGGMGGGVKILFGAMEDQVIRVLLLILFLLNIPLDLFLTVELIVILI